MHVCDPRSDLRRLRVVNRVARVDRLDQFYHLVVHRLDGIVGLSFRDDSLTQLVENVDERRKRHTLASSRQTVQDRDV